MGFRESRILSEWSPNRKSHASAYNLSTHPKSWADGSGRERGAFRDHKMRDKWNLSGVEGPIDAIFCCISLQRDGSAATRGIGR